MKVSLIALVACCAVSGAAFALSPGNSPSRMGLMDDPGNSPPRVAMDDPGNSPPRVAMDDPGNSPPRVA